MFKMYSSKEGPVIPIFSGFLFFGNPQRGMICHFFDYCNQFCDWWIHGVRFRTTFRLHCLFATLKKKIKAAHSSFTFDKIAIVKRNVLSANVQIRSSLQRMIIIRFH